MKKLFSYNGCLSRSEFVGYLFVLQILILCLTAIPIVSMLDIVYKIIFIIGISCLIVQRLHDLDRPSVHLFLLLIPIYNIILILDLFFRKTSEEMQEYNEIQEPILYNEIEGLLILLGIKIVYTIIKLSFSIKEMLSFIFSSAYRDLVSILGQTGKLAFKFGIYTQLLEDAFFFIAYSIICIAFFKKKSFFPILMIVLLSIQASYTFFINFFYNLPYDKFAGNDLAILIGTIIGTLLGIGIQIIYLIKSKRVKETFKG